MLRHGSLRRKRKSVLTSRGACGEIIHVQSREKPAVASQSRQVPEATAELARRRRRQNREPKQKDLAPRAQVRIAESPAFPGEIDTSGDAVSDLRALVRFDSFTFSTQIDRIGRLLRPESYETDRTGKNLAGKNPVDGRRILNGAQKSECLFACFPANALKLGGFIGLAL